MAESNDFMTMSDEDFLKSGPTLYEAEETPSDDMEEDTLADADLEEEDELNPELEDDAEEGEPEDEVPEDESEEDPDTDTEEGDEETPEEAAKDAPVVEGLERLLQPFKANGTEVQAKTPEEALTLMQMGANYTQKMQALQPNLKLLKSLEKNGLLSEDKLNYLIDLSNKDPRAIARLVKESNIDVEELEDSVDYRPNNHQVSDETMRLDAVFSAMENTPTYARCIDVVGNQWDGASKDELTRDPQLISDINEQMQNGIFDKIQKEVTRVKTFGGLNGMSDFNAYKAVGAQMYQRGEFAQAAPAPVKPVATTQIKQQDTARSQKRKAATTPKASRKTTASPSVNPLSMSDEDFLRINNIRIQDKILCL